MCEWKPDICIYHGNCMDGFGAAWAVWRRWGDAMQYIPAQYGRPLDVDVTNKHVLFVDFSMPREHMRDLSAHEIVVLDHHKTAHEALEVWNVDDLQLCDVPAALDMREQALNERIVALFDMNKSGARLAWEFCHPDVTMPRLLAHIEDRDLWRFAIPGSREIHAVLESHDHDFEEWNAFPTNLDGMYEEGKSILRAKQKWVATLCGMASIQDIGGHAVPCVNAPFFLASDVGHELLQRYHSAPFAATYCTVNGMRNYSLRSEDTRADVSQVARAAGGGGHRNAAGFRVPDVPVSF